ncbi:MAG: glycosyltransferase family 2 protein [Pirellulaceae bacterium]|nr:glycosyltransferase family 2 protein [Pirellulaceae bacterium]
MSDRILTALPVFNEACSVDSVLAEVLKSSPHVLVVDDGSVDGTLELLKQRDDIQLIIHPKNLGYGAALRTAFNYAIQQDFEIVVTVDCDGQHEPQRIPAFVKAAENADIVSGSRYLSVFNDDDVPPTDRREINALVTDLINERLGMTLTDSFCGFKAYRVEALRQLKLTENGYAMPLELWVQAAHHRLSICELAVPLIYLDEKRSFGDALDDADSRLLYYFDVLEKSIARVGSTACSTELDTVCGDAAE